MTVTKQMKLGAFLPPPGHHVAAWRHPHAVPDGGVNLAYYVELAKMAERGKFDLMFLSDGAGVRHTYKEAEDLSRWGRVTHFEPITLLSALAAATKHLGLTATASTSYNEPFNIARKFASLDYLSDGRAGWNVVTSATDIEAKNFGLDKQMDHTLRYQRAREFMKVTTGLWDSWEDDAFIYDKTNGRNFDPQKMHVLNHSGEFFKVRGPLNVPRPIQGYPVIVQAGASADGQDFAAQWGEVIFTAAQTLEEAQKFYRRIKQQLAKYGRAPDDVKVMPGIFPVVSRTLEEAKAKYQALQDLVIPEIGLALLSGHLGEDIIDVSKFPLDEPLPDMSQTSGSTSRQKLIIDKAKREGLTVRQLYLSIVGGRGHCVVIGTPETVADLLENWFLNEGADGFNIMPPVLPDGLNDFVDMVIPELQHRGLFRKEYEGKTLRENLGLKRPAFGDAKQRILKE